MGKLPVGWDRSTIGAACEKPQYGWTTKASHDGGTVRLLRTTDISSGTIEWDSVPFCTDVPPDLAKYVLHDGDIVVSRAGSIGTSMLVRDLPQDAVFASYLIRFRAGSSIMPEYLSYFLQSPDYWRSITERASGIAMPNVNAKKLASIELPLPPLDSQAAIVAKLDELFSDLDAGVAALERAKANLARYRAAALKAAVEGTLTAQWRREHPDVEPTSELMKRILIQRRLKWEDAQLRRYEEAKKKPATGWKARYREPRHANVSQPGALPPKWCWATVEQLSTAVVDGVHRKPHYVDSGVPFVTVRNLTAGPGISFERLNYITEKDHEQFIRRTHPEQGDILLSKDGTLGVVRVIRTDRVFSIFVSVALIKPVLREMSDYFGMALESPIVQEQMVPKGSGLQHIHLEDLRQDAVPLAPLAEQARILTIVEGLLSEAQHTAATLESASKRASLIRQGILKAAFEGSLK